MELFEAIHSRRSIRKYTGAPVDDASLKKILSAAMVAPSAGNAQPWHFVVVTDPEILKKIADIHPYVGMAPQAGTAVLVCAELALEKYEGYWVQDCAAAVQNMLLAARGLGLGTVWTGVHPMKEREEAYTGLLGLPDGVRPLALVVLGHPDQPAATKDRFRPERIHANRW